MLKNIANTLITWYIKNKRELPWRNTTDPYKIWLSEIILQQTRVEQGLPYYHRFLKQYPTLKSLAKANDDEVMKLWQGLGYYSRARNLLSTARSIHTDNKGKFPTTWEEIIKLKGIGDYTAAAIASFAFNLKHPVLDGNVYRFITRLIGIETPLKTATTKASVMMVLNEIISNVNDAATFNQALMDFGALQCTPKNPKCAHCPFDSLCIARIENKTGQIPVKGKAISIRERHFNYIIFLTNRNSIYMKKRTANDVWQNLYDFPLIESLKPIALKKIMLDPDFKSWTSKSEITEILSLKPVLHKLSHQNIFVTFHIIKISKFLNSEKSLIFEIEKNIINSFAVPKVIETFLASHYFLNSIKNI